MSYKWYTLKSLRAGVDSPFGASGGDSGAFESAKCSSVRQSGAFLLAMFFFKGKSLAKYSSTTGSTMGGFHPNSLHIFRTLQTQWNKDLVEEICCNHRLITGWGIR